MAYTYFSKTKKGNATTHPPKKQRKCHYTPQPDPILSIIYGVGVEDV